MIHKLGIASCPLGLKNWTRRILLRTTQLQSALLQVLFILNFLFILADESRPPPYSSVVNSEGSVQHRQEAEKGGLN